MHEIDYGTFCPDDEPLSETGEELIARILPAKSLTILTGKAGTGKSFFAAGIAVAVSSGSDYLGFKNRNPGVPLGVAYLAAKGQGCFEERIVAAARVNRSKWPLQIFTLTGNLTLNSSQARQACVAALRREFEKIRETTGVAPGLVIVDALAGAMSERAVETMKAFRQMKNELGVAMLVIEDLDSGPSDAYNYETMADHALCLLAKRDEDWLVTDRRLVGPTGPLCNLDIIAPNGLGLNCYGEPREIGVLVRDWSKEGITCIIGKA